MTNRRKPFDLSVLVFLVASFALVASAWTLALNRGLDQLAERGAGELRLASDRLTGQLQRYRGLAVFLADHPQVGPILRGEVPPDEARALLLETADKSGAVDILVVDASGILRATAREQGGAPSYVGSPFFERAMDGAMGITHFVTRDYQRDVSRVFAFAAPVFSESGPVTGAVLVYADVAAVEAAWRGAWPAIFFSDDSGQVFISSRSEIVFRSRASSDGGAFRGVTEWERGGHRLWDVDAGPYLPREALFLSLDLPVIEMRGEALIDTAPARRTALILASLVAALCLAAGLLLFLARVRRRTLAQANQRLEARVTERTAELKAANSALLAEVGERKEAEAALKQAQGELVQAGKLSALGQMSAGISHELNQPLMAIQSFASNAKAYLDREEPTKTQDNLGRIEELAGRMGRIIKNLRAFARAEEEQVNKVDLGAAVDSALEVAGPRLRRANVEVRWTRPAKTVLVQGGDVRLSQVIVNLLSNAADALEGQTVRQVELSLSEGDPTRLVVADSGPGIADPEKIFDPFYSTKDVGQGTGLGLSISYGIVQAFGGTLKGENRPEGGAVFTLELQSAAQEAAA